MVVWLSWSNAPMVPLVMGTEPAWLPSPAVTDPAGLVGAFSVRLVEPDTSAVPPTTAVAVDCCELVLVAPVSDFTAKTKSCEPAAVFPPSRMLPSAETYTVRLPLSSWVLEAAPKEKLPVPSDPMV